MEQNGSPHDQEAGRERLGPTYLSDLKTPIRPHLLKNPPPPTSDLGIKAQQMSLGQAHGQAQAEAWGWDGGVNKYLYIVGLWGGAIQRGGSL